MLRGEGGDGGLGNMNYSSSRNITFSWKIFQFILNLSHPKSYQLFSSLIDGHVYQRTKDYPYYNYITSVLTILATMLFSRPHRTILHPLLTQLTQLAVASMDAMARRPCSHSLGLDVIFQPASTRHLVFLTLVAKDLRD